MLGVRITGPTAVGVIVNVCEADELLKVRTMGLDRPPPVGVMVIVPVYTEFGVTVKVPDNAFSVPPAGPVKLKLVAGIIVLGITGLLEADAAVPGPMIFTAWTETSYAVPFVRPGMVQKVADAAQLAIKAVPPA